MRGAPNTHGREMHTKFWWENLKGRDDSLATPGCRWEDKDRGQWGAAVNMVLNRRVP